MNFESISVDTRRILLAGCVSAIFCFSFSFESLAQSRSTESTVPESGFFTGLGGRLDSIEFGTQNIYGYATSDVFRNGVQVSGGAAGGPGTIEMDSKNKLSPTAQIGYFRRFPSSDWLWGGRISYAYLSSTSTVANALLPQSGSSMATGSGVSVPFTGNAVIRSYQTSIKDQIVFTPFIGRAFSQGFVYVGAGPTMSRVQTKLNGVIGFADITGVPSDISGLPQNFSDSRWVAGGAVTVGAAYFFDPSWFLDIRYTYAMTSKPTVTYPATFTNPNGVNGTTISGSGYTTSAGRVVTQGIALTINKLF